MVTCPVIDFHGDFRGDTFPVIRFFSRDQQGGVNASPPLSMQESIPIKSAGLKHHDRRHSGMIPTSP